jgi:L-ascorbate metabolism protein UlaG (beta-lactamase superfamily)
MALIDELYKPEILLLCSGGHYTMGPVEAALSVSKFFKCAKVVIPMHFNTFPPVLPDTFPELRQTLLE